MKNLILAVVLILVASAQVALSESVFVGRIISVVPNEGAIFGVDPSLSAVYEAVAVPRSPVFVYGNFSGCVDGDLFRIFADPRGTYTYTTVMGANSTVQAFSLHQFNPAAKSLTVRTDEATETTMLECCCASSLADSDEKLSAFVELEREVLTAK